MLVWRNTVVVLGWIIVVLLVIISISRDEVMTLDLHVFDFIIDLALVLLREISSTLSLVEVPHVIVTSHVHVLLIESIVINMVSILRLYFERNVIVIGNTIHHVDLGNSTILLQILSFLETI